jgi:hypothetical protein
MNALDLHIPQRVLIEVHAGEPDARDILVEMVDGTIYTAVFVTLDHLRRQMSLMYDLCAQVPDTVPTRFAVLEVPHIIVDKLDRDYIEETIENLLALETFTSVFIRVTETEAETTGETTTNGKRATQELAAVVLSDVIVVES